MSKDTGKTREDDRARFMREMRAANTTRRTVYALRNKTTGKTIKRWAAS